MEIRRSLGIEVEVHPPWGMTRTDPHLDPELPTLADEPLEIHLLGDAVPDQCPPDVFTITGRVNYDRRVALSCALEIDRRLTIAGEEGPSFDPGRVNWKLEMIEILEKLAIGGASDHENEEACEDEPI
jgi:hypothetical protein